MAFGGKLDLLHLLIGVFLALVLGYMLGARRGKVENFQVYSRCDQCKYSPCRCGPNGGSGSNSGPAPAPACPPCPEPDPSKWVLKASVPPCPPMPDMSKYMLKTECPPQPDMSKYVLKTSVPKCPPCISTCSKPCKIGECPPCPRPRCPVVKCPDPKPCPACPAATCAPCPEPDIKCKAAYTPGTPVRPMLASTSTFGF